MNDKDFLEINGRRWTGLQAIVIASLIGWGLLVAAAVIWALAL